MIAYAVVSLGTGMQTWASGDRIGDIHDIVVSPRQRGHGVGSMLLDEIDRELAVAGISEQRLTVMAANHDALRLYQRRGLQLMSHNLLGPVIAPQHGHGCDTA